MLSFILLPLLATLSQGVANNNIINFTNTNSTNLEVSYIEELDQSVVDVSVTALFDFTLNGYVSMPYSNMGEGNSIYITSCDIYAYFACFNRGNVGYDDTSVNLTIDFEEPFYTDYQHLEDVSLDFYIRCDKHFNLDFGIQYSEGGYEPYYETSYSLYDNWYYFKTWFDTFNLNAPTVEFEFNEQQDFTLDSGAAFYDQFYNLNDTNLSLFKFEVGTSSFQQGFEKGYDEGYSQGELFGYSEGYNVGFNEGFSADSTAFTIFNGILSVGFVPINFFLSIFNFEVLGINIKGLVSALLTVALVVVIIRVITGKSQGE